MSDWASLTPTSQANERRELKRQAQEYQKGCEFHFRSSAKRLKQDSKLVAAEKISTFEDFLTTIMAPETTPDSFDKAVVDFQVIFPSLKNWLFWWMQPKIASMIFPARRTMSEDIASSLPNTSNPVEAQHSLLHHSSSKLSHEGLSGVQEIFLHVQKLEEQWKAIKGAIFS